MPLRGEVKAVENSGVRKRKKTREGGNQRKVGGETKKEGENQSDRIGGHLRSPKALCRY